MLSIAEVMRINDEMNLRAGAEEEVGKIILEAKMLRAHILGFQDATNGVIDKGFHLKDFIYKTEPCVKLLESLVEQLENLNYDSKKV